MVYLGMHNNIGNLCDIWVDLGITVLFVCIRNHWTYNLVPISEYNQLRSLTVLHTLAVSETTFGSLSEHSMKTPR